MKINLNNYIIFEPRSIEAARNVYKNKLQSLEGFPEKWIEETLESCFDKYIKNGKVKMQLHDFAHIFGDELYNGSSFLKSTILEYINEN